jgi:HlyD family secretion protein
MNNPEVALPSVPAVVVPVRVPGSPESLAKTPTGVLEATSRRTPRRRWGPSRRRLAVLGLLVVAAGIGAYFYTRHLSSSPAVQMARVTRGPLVARVSATGTLNAVITVQVGSQVSGQIKELYADFNSQVTKGQVIARIDPAIFQAQVDEAQAQVQAARATVLSQQAMVAKTRADLANEQAGVAVAQAQTAKAQVAVVDGQRTLDRQRQLQQRQLIAQADVDAAQVASDSDVAQHTATAAQEKAQAAVVQSGEAQLKVAEAQLQSAAAQVGQYEAALRQAQLNLDHSIIRAPVDGVVIARNVDVGQTVAASLQAPTLFLIAQDLTKMQVDTSVDESDVDRLALAQPVTFTVGSISGRVFSGLVVQVRKAPLVLQNVVTYDVVVSAPNPELKLLPGMTANVQIITDQKDNALKVPNAALRFRPPGAETGPVQSRATGPAASQGSGPRPASGAQPGLAAQVWVADPGGKLRAIPLRLGITDGLVTEVLEGGLTDQQDVIVGLNSAANQPAGPNSGPRLGL